MDNHVHSFRRIPGTLQEWVCECGEKTIASFIEDRPQGILTHKYKSFWEWLIGQKTYEYTPLNKITTK